MYRQGTHSAQGAQRVQTLGEAPPADVKLEQPHLPCAGHETSGLEILGEVGREGHLEWGHQRREH